MKVTFLGTGTSHGIPVVGCSCEICRSNKIRNKRYRSSIFIETDISSILIDAATEFRLQAVRNNIDHIDFILMTHAHADHLHGIDDLRTLTRRKKIDVFGSRNTITDMKTRFNYIFSSSQKGGGKPDMDFRILEENCYTERSFSDINTGGKDNSGEKIVPIPVKHGSLDIYGYRIGNFAYITDCSYIPDKSMKLLEGVDVITLGALRYRQHPTHFTIDQAVETINKTGAKFGYLTHFCHDIDHEKLEKELPDNIRPAFDSMQLYIQSTTASKAIGL